MRTYEFNITPEAVAKDGMATVSSICGYMINAAYRTMSEEGYDMCLLSKCSIEIDERPKSGDIINIMVNSGVNTIVSLLNRSVVITDNEGNEIGRGEIEWLLPKVSDNKGIREAPARIVKRYINKFHDIIPDLDSIADLQFRIEMDFRKMAHNAGDVSVAFKKICDSSYLFLARSGAETLCRALLQTA